MTTPTKPTPPLAPGQVWRNTATKCIYFTTPSATSGFLVSLVCHETRRIVSESSCIEGYEYLDTFAEYQESLRPKPKQRRWWTDEECAWQYLNDVKWLYRKIGEDAFYPGEFKRIITGEWYVASCRHISVIDYSRYERTRDLKTWELLGVEV